MMITLANLTKFLSQNFVIQSLSRPAKLKVKVEVFLTLQLFVVSSASSEAGGHVCRVRHVMFQ